MSILAVETHALAEKTEFTDNDMVVSLVDGRKVIIPLVWFPRLANATIGQLGGCPRIAIFSQIEANSKKLPEAYS